MGLVQLMREAAQLEPSAAASEEAAKAAEHEARAALGAFGLQSTANVRVRDERPPVLSSFQAVRRQTWQADASLSKLFASGDALSAELSVSRLDQRFDSPFAAQLARLNPAWQSQARLRLTAPLLAGRGRKDIAASRIAALARATQARAQAAIARRGTALQALLAALQLLEDEARASLAQQALARAQKLVAYQRTQRRLGLVEEADLLAARARVAARRAELAKAQSALVVDRTRIAALLRKAHAPRVEIGALPAVPLDAPLPQLLATARKHRPELAELDAALRAAEAALAAARDRTRPELSLVAEAGAQGLAGNGARALSDALQAKHPVFGLGLALRGRDPAAAERLAAAAARVEEARARKAAFLESLKREIREGVAALQAARAQLAALKAQLAATRARYEAELARYRKGRGRFPELLAAEDALARAQHAVSLAELGVVRARMLLAFRLGLVP